jgi:hypothetical protein
MKTKEMTCSICVCKTTWRRSSNMSEGETWFKSIVALGFGHMVRRFYWTCMGCNKTFEE